MGGKWRVGQMWYRLGRGYRVGDRGRALFDARRLGDRVWWIGGSGCRACALRPPRLFTPSALKSPPTLNLV